jgi:hypothetical protein
MARTAVVAGTATAVAGGVSRRQQAKAQQSSEAQAYEQQQAAPPPPPAAAAGPDMVEQLQELAKLKDQGILTDAEFAAQKAKILGS